MKRTKGFTLVELLVVVAIIALLVSILLPTLGKAKEQARRAMCSSNIGNIGKGIMLYQTDNDDYAPWIRSDNWQTTTTGTNADEIVQPETLSASALMFLIVRSGTSPDIYLCPSDDKASKMTSAKHTEDDESYYYWDFFDDAHVRPGDKRHVDKVSYSYQAPLYNGSNYSSGSEVGGGDMVIMSDQTPRVAGKKADTDWTADDLSEQDRKDGISQNHGGNFMSVLFADAHVGSAKRADIGIDKDNIFSASEDEEETQQGAGSLDVADHLCESDSYLIGPVTRP